MVRWSRKKIIALVLVLLMLPVAGVFTVNFVFNSIPVTLEIKLVDEKGNLVQGSVAIYEITPDGARKIWAGSGPGMVTAVISVPMKEVGVAEIEGKVVKVYKSINLDIVAGNKELRKVGIVSVVIDPTFSGSATYKSVTIVMRDAPSVEQTPPTGVWYTWQYTTVLSFATWDSINASYSYPAGAKIVIEKVSRPYGSSTWGYAGDGEVTLDRGIESPWLSGRYNYILKFEIKYYYAIYEVEGLYTECMGPVDTSTDPINYTRSTSSWNGQLPSGGSYYLTPAGDTTHIPVTKGSTYSFYVAVTFSYPRVVSAVLGVTKKDVPQVYLHITSSASHGGYVKTVSSDGFLTSYSNWV